MRAPALILLLLLLPVAAAQNPIAAGVELSAGETEGSASLDAPAILTVTVTNTGQGSGTPVDRPADVSLAVSTPEGWSAEVTPATFQLAPGASTTATVTIAVTADASAKEAAVEVKAFLRGDAPDEFGGTATDSITLSITRSDTLTRSILEGIGDWVWLLFLALLAALLVASKFALDRRRVAVQLTCGAPQLAVKPGGRVAFPLRVQNIAKRRDQLRFRLSPMEEGWGATMPVDTLELDSGRAEEMHLVLYVPKGARVGTRQTVSVVAQSDLAPAHPGSVTVEAVVEE